jgi:hypothetical protein
MKLEDIMKSIGNDVLTEDSKKTILEAFESIVNEKVNQRVALEVETAVKRVDEDHYQKLQKLLEAIDEDHTNKFKKVMIKMDSDYASKLQTVSEKYQAMVEKEAIEFREQLINEISNYIELYIEKIIPSKQIQEACENTKAKAIVEKMKKLVSVDESFINNNIKEALEDGKSTIDSLRKELNEAVKENIKINQELKKIGADLVLEKKTANLTNDKKSYVMRVLGNKSPEYISENFDYVVEMFERDDSEKMEVITEEATKKVKSKSVDTPKSQIENKIIEENVNEDDSSVKNYLTVLKSQDRS